MLNKFEQCLILFAWHSPVTFAPGYVAHSLRMIVNCTFGLMVVNFSTKSAKCSSIIIYSITSFHCYQFESQGSFDGSFWWDPGQLLLTKQNTILSFEMRYFTSDFEKVYGGFHLQKSTMLIGDTVQEIVSSNSTLLTKVSIRRWLCGSLGARTTSGPGTPVHTYGREAKLPLRAHLFICMFLHRGRFWSLSFTYHVGLLLIQC